MNYRVKAIGWAGVAALTGGAYELAGLSGALFLLGGALLAEAHEQRGEQ